MNDNSRARPEDGGAECSAARALTRGYGSGEPGRPSATPVLPASAASALLRAGPPGFPVSAALAFAALLPLLPASAAVAAEEASGAAFEEAGAGQSTRGWRPAAASVYIGAGTEYKFRDALKFQYESARETMYALTFDWDLAPDNLLNRGAGWLGATLEPGVLLAYRDDRQQDIDIYEFALYGTLRWSRFPWSDTLPTTIAIAWGLSYTSDITANEAEDAEKTDPDEGPQRWLNYLAVEYGFSPPSHPRWQFFYRLHHRSGASGLFASHEVGSNVMGFGVRYRLDPGGGR